MHLIGDLVGLLDALGKETAVIVGHDWGAPVAWYSALLRPDRFRGVAGLSVPFMPRGAVYPSKTFPETADAIFYQSYFQVPGVAETELEEDVHRTISGFLYNASGDSPRHTANQPSEPAYMVPRKGGVLADPPSLPAWVTESDIDVYVDAFTRSGWRGPLSWWRNIDRSWELLAPFSGAAVSVPAGKFTATKIEIRVFDNGVEMKDAHFLLYLANDAARTPVLMEAVLPVATARVELKKAR